jgi:hypothetical protein
VVLQKEFRTFDDVLAVREQYIFNCLGEEVRAVFKDSSVHPIRDYFYDIPNTLKTSSENVAFWVGSELEKEDFVVLVASNKMQVGSINSGGDNQENEQNARSKLLTRAYHFVLERTHKPSKL